MVASTACLTTQVLATRASLATSSPTVQVSLTVCPVPTTVNIATDQPASTASQDHFSAILPASSVLPVVLLVQDQHRIALPADSDTLSPSIINAATPKSTATRIAQPAFKPIPRISANPA